MESVTRDVFPKHNRLHKTDYVAADGRRKELILMEEKARKSWQDKWKFLEKDNIEKLHQELSLKLGLDQDFIKSRYRGEKEKQEMEYLQNLKRMPVPRLTSGMIGWRSSDPECWIDMSGLMYVSDKTYPLSEPTQSLHEQWKCIWLG